MNLKGKQDAIVIGILVVWLAVWVLAITNHFVIGMELIIVLLLLNLMLGCSHKDKLDAKLFIYPMLCWAVVWAIGFYLAYANSLPDYENIKDHLFGGFHPSFGPVIYLFWIGGMLTMALGFSVQKDRWLSEENWEIFKKELAEIQKNEEVQA